jgi:hypothetical protein
MHAKNLALVLLAACGAPDARTKSPAAPETTVVIGPAPDAASPPTVLAQTAGTEDDAGDPCSGDWRPGQPRLANRTVSMRQGTAQVNGRLPPEVIQRIVRQNFGRFRLCYENGLRSDENLQGRVTIAFTIGPDGSVSSAADGGSDLPNQCVISCIARGFRNLSFPQPEGGGVVLVGYPILFNAGTPKP